MPISPRLHAQPARPARPAPPSWLARVGATAVATALLVCTAPVFAGVPPAAAVAVLAPHTYPVQGPVVATFDAPTRYGPGHRGVDLAAEVGTAVRASAAGTVTFAGRVVDATWVTVDHGTVRTTVGPLGTVAVRRGQRVARGAVLGTSGHAHGRAALHWSLRRGDTYLDPLTAGSGPLAAGRRVASLVPRRPGRRGALDRPGGVAVAVPRPTTSPRPPPPWRHLRVR